MGNPLAYLMLALWPVLCGIMFQRMEPQKAFIWSILGAYMLLSPLTYIPMPVLPDLGKNSVSTVAATLFAMGAGYKVLTLPRDPLLKVLIFLFVLWPIVTMLGNPEPLVEGISYRPALTPYDTFSTVVDKLFTLLPFLAARAVLNRPDSPKLMMRALLTGGLIYSAPMLIEMRLSPQINVWVYGYFAHDFIQMIRYGGFRPMVFMEHGLWVALFTFMAAASAAALVRQQGFSRNAIMALLWMMLLLVLCKSMAPIMYGIIVIPLLLFAPPRLSVTIAGVFAVIVLVFPLLRLAGWVPVEQVTAAALAVDQDRAASLIFRLRNEDILLVRAVEKLWTGWGGYGRNLIVDPINGLYETISDGRWIITLGSEGLPGYIAEFGLYTLPVLAAWRSAAARRDLLLASLTLIHATALLDLIPNATITPLTFLLAGLIVGRVEQLQSAPEDGQLLPVGPRRHRVMRQVGLVHAPGIRSIL